MRSPLLLALLAAACAAPAPLPPQDPAAAAAAEPGEEAAEIRQTQWNGLEVTGIGYLDEAELRFARAGKLVHRERDETAHHWAVFPPSDLDGDGTTDLQAWFWTGGAHCCFTTLVYRGRPDGKVSAPGAAWRLDMGDSEARPFAPLAGYKRPVLAVFDTSSAYVSGSFAETPMYPYFVEADAGGLRLAEPLMRSARPGEGPRVLRDGPPAWRALILANLPREEREAGGIAPPAERLRAIRARLDAAAAPGRDGTALLAEAQLLPTIERHIKLHCVYDAACDIPALAAEVEGERKGLLKEWAKELEESWTGSTLYRLKQRR